jgi:hypothetical protein
MWQSSISMNRKSPHEQNESSPFPVSTLCLWSNQDHNHHFSFCLWQSWLIELNNRSKGSYLTVDWGPESLRATVRVDFLPIRSHKAFDQKNIEPLRIDGEVWETNGGMKLRLWPPLMANDNLCFGEGGVHETRRWVVSSGYWSGLEEKRNKQIDRFLDRLIFSAPSFRAPFRWRFSIVDSAHAARQPPPSLFVARKGKNKSIGSWFELASREGVHENWANKATRDVYSTLK